MTENKNICCDSEDIDVEKVTELELVFRMIGEKPYYEIKYKKVGENFYHVGYSSYNVKNVLIWKKAYFELVETKPTNADRIRSMTDEELADTIFESCTEYMGLDECKYPDCNINEQKKVCRKCVLEWLKSESEVGKNA